MFSCKACKSKDAHIETLLAQVDLLRSLLPPQTSQTPTSALEEADRLLSGEGPLPVALDEMQQKHLDEIQSEAARLLTGNY